MWCGAFCVVVRSFLCCAPVLLFESCLVVCRVVPCVAIVMSFFCVCVSSCVAIVMSCFFFGVFFVGPFVSCHVTILPPLVIGRICLLYDWSYICLIYVLFLSKVLISGKPLFCKTRAVHSESRFVVSETTTSLLIV